MKPGKTTATPAELSGDSPDSKDGVPSSALPPEEQEQLKSPPRLVGSLVDPAVEEEEYLFSGPREDSPSAFSEPPREHPVRARLLAKAQQFQSGEPSSAPQLPVPTPPPAPVQVTPLPNPFGEEPRFTRPAEPEPPAPEPPTFETAAFAQPPNEAPLPSSAPPPSSEPKTASPLALELERIAGHAPAPWTPSRLNPNLVALLGGLLGLTFMGSLGILFSRLSEGDSSQTPTSAQPGENSEEAAAAPETESAPPAREKKPGPWRIADEKDAVGKRIIQGKIGKQPFLTAIQNAGLARGEAYRAYISLKDIRNLDRCGASDQFIAQIDAASKKLLAFEYVVNPEEIYQATTGEDGLLRGKRLDLQVERNQVRRALVHDGQSFEESAQRAGFDSGLSRAVAKALAGHMMLDELKARDRLRVIVQEVTVLGEFSRYAGVEAIEVLRDGKKPERYYYYSHPQEGGYFDASGKAPFEGGWRKPMPGAPVTSKFNMTRMHPVLKRVMPHNGTDFGAPTGTPIGATAPGVISFMGMAGPSGNLVKIKHAGGYESGYAHLSRYGENLKVGDSVERMQVIGYCGSTGRSTGPHLHFTMQKDGKFIDPESLHLDGMRVLPPSHRAEFAQVREKYDPILDSIALPALPALPSEPSLPEESTPSPGSAEVPDLAEAPSAAPVPPSSPPPSSPLPSAPAAGPATRVAPKAIFLSDSDLLKMQSATDEGEVRP